MCSFLFTNRNIPNLDEANKFIKLRGPDYTSHVKHEGFNLVHNILSITGKFTPQPFIEDDIVCMYNGEIYNHQEFGTYESDGQCIIPVYNKYREIDWLDG